MNKLVKTLEQQQCKELVQENVDRIAENDKDLSEIACNLFKINYDNKMVGRVECFIPTDDKTELTNWLIEKIVNDKEKNQYLYDYIKIILLSGLSVDLVQLDKAERETEYNFTVSDVVGAVLYRGENIDFSDIELQLESDPTTAWIVAENIQGFLRHEVKIDFAKLAKNILVGKNTTQCAYMADHLKLFLDGGADIDICQLVEILERDESGYCSMINNLEEFMEAGASIDTNKLVDYFIERGNFLAIAENIRELVKYGAEIDLTDLVYNLMNRGAICRRVVKDNFCWFLANGAQISLLRV